MKRGVEMFASRVIHTHANSAQRHSRGQFSSLYGVGQGVAAARMTVQRRRSNCTSAEHERKMHPSKTNRRRVATCVRTQPSI